MAAGNGETIQLSRFSFIQKFMAPHTLVQRHQQLGRDTEQFHSLWRLHPRDRGTVVMFGNQVRTPRFQESYGKPYTFAGQTLYGGPVPEQLQPFLDWANNEMSLPDYMLLGPSGQRPVFNGILLNWYENGHDHINLHSDSDAQLVPGAPIISLSLGAMRTFRVRRKERAGSSPCDVQKIDVEMPHGMVLVMAGRMQKEFLHGVAEISGAKGKGIRRRINITLRAFKETSSSKGPAQQAAAPGKDNNSWIGQRWSDSDSDGEAGGSGPPAKRQRASAG